MTGFFKVCSIPTGLTTPGEHCSLCLRRSANCREERCSERRLSSSSFPHDKRCLAAAVVVVVTGAGNGRQRRRSFTVKDGISSSIAREMISISERDMCIAKTTGLRRRCLPVNRLALVLAREIARVLQQGKLFIQILAEAEDGKGLRRTLLVVLVVLIGAHSRFAPHHSVTVSSSSSFSGTLSWSRGVSCLQSTEQPDTSRRGSQALGHGRRE